MCATGPSATGKDSTRVLGDPSSPKTGLRQADAPSAGFPCYSLAVRTPSARCARMADSLGVRATPEPALRDIDYGHWCGRTVADVAASDPHGYSAWFTDPDAAPHGGESVRQLCQRTAQWLSSVPLDTERALAIVEPAVIRAALVHALQVPVRAFWHLDMPRPPAITLLHRDGNWTVRFGDVTFPHSRQEGHETWARPYRAPSTTGAPPWPPPGGAWGAVV
ncbi:histidine phosphatase family protein [Streptomyces canus]|uniref:histidine phosphatase family protein n=2 Tax=Streptomyces TaxID=1883 RepID=UPI003CF537EF